LEPSLQRKAVAKIRAYLQYEHLERNDFPLSFRKDNMKLNHAVIPLQPNSCDCGIYLLHYVELIFKTPAQFLEKDLPNLSQWFSSEEIDNKRQEIAFVIQDLALKSKSIPECGKDKKSQAVFPLIRFSGEAKWGRHKKLRTSGNDGEESRMLFQSPPREVAKENENRSSFIGHSSNSTKDNKFRSDITHDKTNSYDTSNNMNYFVSKPQPGLISRIASAFNEHASKINNTSMEGSDWMVVGKRKGVNSPSLERSGSDNEQGKKHFKSKEINTRKFVLANRDAEKAPNSKDVEDSEEL
jgi:Ulp1 family protease